MMKRIDENNPFKIPEGYFDNLKDRLLAKLNENIPDLPKEDGFGIPDNYFENFQIEVDKLISTEETKVIKVQWHKKYYWAAAAAILLLLVGLNLINLTKPTFDNLASSDIETYFEENELGLSSYEIAEVLPIDELQINEMLESQFVETEVLDYLDDHIDDIEDLNFEDYE